MENFKSFFVPQWVKGTSFAIITIVLVISIFFVINFTGKNERDILVIGLSLGQVASSALILLLIAFYSERDITSKRLMDLTFDFIGNSIPNALEDLDVDSPDFYLFGKEKAKRVQSTNTKIRVKKSSQWFCFLRN